jgi:hypothetical protein
MATKQLILFARKHHVNLLLQLLHYYHLLLYYHIISTDEDPCLWIESFAVINLHGVSTNKILLKVKLAGYQLSCNFFN